jgi:hypothetical protein
MPEIACKVCGLGDREEVLLLCDRCDEGFHTYCIGIGRVPRVKRWFCQECIERQPVEQRVRQRKAMKKASEQAEIAVF